MPNDESQQRRERSAELQLAIEKYLEGLGFGGILGDWVMVASIVRVDDDGDPDCDYAVAMRGGTLLQHVVLGLLSKAEDVLVAE